MALHGGALAGDASSSREWRAAAAAGPVWGTAETHA